MLEYDIIIIGAGPGGRAVALEGAARGLRVVVIDEGPTLGGDDAFTALGALLRLGLAWEDARLEAVPGLHLDAEATRHTLHRRVKRALQACAGDRAFALERAGVELIRGHGEAVAEGRVQVGDRQLTARSIVLATGDAPRRLPGVPEHPRALTFEQLMAAPIHPEHLIIAGGGPLGVACAGAFAALGVRVTLAQRGERLLPGVEPEASAEVGRMLNRREVKIHTDVELGEVELTDGGVRARLTPSAGGQARSVSGSHLLMTAGRLRSDAPTVEGVYTVGAAARPCTAAEAEAEGRALVARLTGEAPSRRHPVKLLPGRPEVGSVGVGEAEARASAAREGQQVRVGVARLGESPAARVAGQSWGWVKVIASGPYNEIVGVHAVGPAVGPLLDVAQPLMEMEATLGEWAQVPWRQTSWARSLGAAASAALEQAP